jgi:glycolate oxidase iron-sulfur subunit
LADGPSSHFQDIFAQCLLCGACEDNCSRQLPIREHIVQARSKFSHLYGRHPLQRALVRKALSNPVLLEGLVKAGLSLSRLSLLPAKSGLRIKLGLLEKSDNADVNEREQGELERIPGKSGLSYFSGCMARYLQPSIGKATSLLVEDVTGESSYEPDAQVCCGLAAWSAGKVDEARRLARKNIEVFSQTSGQILTSCASCSSHLKKYPTLFKDDPHWREKAEKFSRRVREFTSFVDAALQEGTLEAARSTRVYYHEPCHMRFDKENSGAPLQLLEKIDNISLVGLEEGPHCCGQGGLFHLGYPELSEEIFSQAYDLLCQGDADVAVTTCSGCLMQWQAGLAVRKSQVQAVHLAVWLRSCMQING